MNEEKLLGIYIKSDLKWSKQIDKVVNDTNYVLSKLKRLRQHLGKKELKILADGLFMSKLRYCLPVYAAESIRLEASEPKSTQLQKLQRNQNKMLRTITGTRQRDHVRIADLLQSTGFLSVNQSAAYGLLVEVWKAREFSVPVLGNILDRRRNDTRTLRSDSANVVAAMGQDELSINCARLWNMSTPKFKNTNLLKVAKAEAKTLAKTLPI